MSEIIGHNGYVIFFGGLPIIHPTYYHVYVSETSHGTVTVDHNVGPSGTLVTISTVPDTGYELKTISLTGAELINGNQFFIDDSDVYVNVAFRIDTNPLNLPPNTVRVRTSDGNPPNRSAANHGSYDTATLVPGTTDVYDVYKSGTDFSHLLDRTIIIEVLGANTTGITNMSNMFYECNGLQSPLPLFDTSSVTNMEGMFRNCYSLTSVPLFDTSSVTNMREMFENCPALRSVPLFDTSKVIHLSYMFFKCGLLESVPLFDTSSATDMIYMFSNCYKVKSGALALYQRASSQANPPSSHFYAFENCGRDTVTGAAELAQIPSGWK